MFKNRDSLQIIILFQDVDKSSLSQLVVYDVSCHDKFYTLVTMRYFFNSLHKQLLKTLEKIDCNDFDFTIYFTKLLN